MAFPPPLRLGTCGAPTVPGASASAPLRPTSSPPLARPGTRGVRDTDSRSARSRSDQRRRWAGDVRPEVSRAVGPRIQRLRAGGQLALPPVEQNPSEQSESRSHVPPGFERRTFGPFPDEPDHTESGGGGPGLADVGPPATPNHELRYHPAALCFRRFRGADVLPPLPPFGSLAMPSTFAPPQPEPWTDSGWTSSSARPGPGGGSGWSGRERPCSRGACPRVLMCRTLRYLTVTLRSIRRPTEWNWTGSQRSCAKSSSSEPEDATGRLRRRPGTRSSPGRTRRPDAQLRWKTAGQSLRIEFVDGADEGEVTRASVRLFGSRWAYPQRPVRAADRRR